MKTEAAILVETGKPLIIAELGIPELKPGHVLVDIAFSGACHTQVLEARGYRGEDKWLPHCLGHEGSGTVVAVGSAATKVKVGDKVVLSWIKGTGAEAGGAIYRWNGQNVNAGGVTTFQRMALASENRLSLVPPDVPMDVAVLLGCAAPTGMGSICNVAQVKIGESVVVFGTGGIGLNACMAAAILGGAPVIGVDPNPMKRALAKLFGASHVIDPHNCDVISAIKEIQPGGVDVAIESTGIPAVMEQSINAIRPQGGRVVVIGNARFGQTIVLDPGSFNQGKSMLGSWGGNAMPDRDYGRFGQMLSSEKFLAKNLLSAPYPLSKINSALADLEAGRVARPIIDMRLE